MPRTWTYREGDYVMVNEKVGLDAKASIGRIGVITECLNNITYDYRVKFDKDKFTVKFTEDELDRLYYRPEQKVIYKNNGELVKITKLDYPNKQVGIQFMDGAYAVVGLLDIKRVEESDLMQDCSKDLKINNADLHKQIIDEMHDTYLRKNADYGNSFEEQFNEYGMLSVLIRLDDKMRRLKQLHKNEAQVKDESVRDTIMDLANYAIMSVMELDKK